SQRTSRIRAEPGRRHRPRHAGWKLHHATRAEQRRPGCGHERSRRRAGAPLRVGSRYDARAPPPPRHPAGVSVSGNRRRRAGDQRYTAAAMNNRGQVIGAAASAYGYEGDLYRHPVLWTDRAIQDLGVLRAGGDTPSCYDPIYHPDGFCSDGTATDINERGDVVGDVTDTTHLVRPFLWRDGQLGDLGVLPGMNAFAIASNERGQVAGYGG